MKLHELRRAGVRVYFKLAVWDADRMCWRDGGEQFFTYEAAMNAAELPGRYRVSEVPVSVPGARRDLEPFEVQS